MTGALIATTLAGWVVLDCLARHRAAKGRPKTRIEADQGSAVFAQTTGLGSLLLGLSLLRWLPSLALPGAAWTWAAIGLPVAWAGIALRIASVTTLGSMFNPLVAIHDDHVVVEHGPYRFLRHANVAMVDLPRSCRCRTPGQPPPRAPTGPGSVPVFRRAVGHWRTEKACRSTGSRPASPP